MTISRRSLSLSLTLGSAALLASQSHAALLAYDGFGPAYDSSGGYADPTMGPSNALVWSADTSGGVTTGQAPVIPGFSTDAWHRDNESGTIGGLVYPRVQSTQSNSYQTALNQKVDTTSGEVSIFRPSGGSVTASKNFARTLDIGKSNTYGLDIYVSGIFTFTSTVVDSYFDSASINRSAPDFRNFRMAIGADGSISLTGNNATEGTAAAGTIVAGQSYFFVWRLNNLSTGSSGDTLSLFLNPTDLSSEAANSVTAATSGSNGDFFVTGSSAWELDNLAFGALIGGGNQFIVDELRVGKTWADVTPFTIVPEPSAALLSLCGAALLLRRRR